MSEAGCPAADATSDSGPDHLPQAPTQSARCSAVRGGPAGRRSHPGRREMQTNYRLNYISSINVALQQKDMYLMYESYFLTELTLCFYWVVCQIDIFDICLGSLPCIIFVVLHYGELPYIIILCSKCIISACWGV